MKIFLDTLDLNQIKKYANLGLLFGVTTNPTFSKRFGMHNDIEMVEKVREALGKGEIHIEAFGKTKNEIIKNANRLLDNTNDDNLIFKIPFSESGVQSCEELISNDIKTSLHLIFSVNQAMLAATIKSTYICPLIGRLDDIGHDAIQNIKMIKDAYDSNLESTLIMISSVRHPQHVQNAYTIGIDAITIPPNVLSDSFYHPLTNTGIRTFHSDIEATKQISTKTINQHLIVSETDTIKHCLSLMVIHKSGAVAVCASNNQLVGIFTAGDLKRCIQQEGFDTNNDISKYMNTSPISINITESVSKARSIFHDFNVDQLVVVDGELVKGIISTNDINE